MATNYVLKPFRFNFSDLKFLRAQIDFRPLFDADGNPIINWDGTGTVYNAEHVAYADMGSPALNTAAYGQSYASVTASQGLRDPSGLLNNLYLVNATWGAVDQPFLQRTQVVYDQYVKPLSATDEHAFYAKKFASGPDPALADYTKRGDDLSTPDVNEASPTRNIVDYTPRMISQLTTTAGVTFVNDGTSSHLVKDGNGFTQVADYGMLAKDGQQDAQRSINADGTANTEYFIGAQNPGVSPVNGWFVLFGQFFDHGLDFVGKGGDGTRITINLAPDDPLYGVIDPTTGQPATKIVISRADVSGFTADGTPQWNNHTSPYIDQSQTYGSNQEVTDLLREWVTTDGTTYHAGAHMLDGKTSKAWTNAFGETTKATLPTLNELRAHLLATGRDDLTWGDVLNLRNRDANGHVLDSDSTTAGVQSTASGQALLLDMNPRFTTAHFTTGTIDALAKLGIVADANGNYALGGPNSLGTIIDFRTFEPMASSTSDPLNALAQEVLLESVGNHYIAGDGRVNENIGLTAVHHVWHEEHNFQVRNIQQAVIAEDARQERLDQAGTYNHDLLHEWQVVTGTKDEASGNYLNADGSIAWNEEKLFNAAKITVEMEYQHTAVDQFARTITPNIAEFVGYNSGEQGDVSLDFSQVAYRFGHSTLRESIDLIDPAGDITGAVMRVALERAFLTPELFAQKGAAAIALGMTHQQANEIDEFVTPALNQGLLGMPLDLAAINIARGRDLGIPTLNEFRKAIGLSEYASWADFGANMIHPDNLVNFIAAYSFDGNVALAQAIINAEQGKAGSASALVAALATTGVTIAENAAYNYALDFLQNTDPSLYGVDGFQHIDTWLGGLAEVHVTGGLLGETFDTVFADQISRLMNGDRFYYLYRLDQLQMGEGIINEQFKDIVERNTGVEHLNGSVFAYADKYYDLAETANANAKTEHKYGDLFVKNVALDGLPPSYVLAAATETGAVRAVDVLGVYSTAGNATTGNGAIVSMNGVQYIRDLRVEDSAATAINGGENLDGTPNSGAESHEVIVASDKNDLIYAWGGDDTVYGERGDDIIYGGNGIDRLYGGDGNDRIFGGDGGDLLDGGAGDDYVSGEQTAVAAAGIDQVIGGEGNDILHSGVGIDKLSGESGDDVIFGEGDTDAFTHGGDGNDIIDGGAGGDLLWGDDGDDLIIGGDDQDISAGLNGDDILRPGSFSQAMGGGPDEVLGGDGKSDFGNDGKGIGFDLIDFSDHAVAPQGIVIDFSTQQNPLVAIDRTTPFPAWVGIEGVIASRNDDSILGDANGNWLIGGSGNDRMTGAAGNDVVVGDGIRLDSLIGTYAGDYTGDIDGASHRADGFIGTNGLLDAAGTEFDKHFTEMLKSATFENLELGGSQVTRLWRNGVAGSDLADSVTVGDGGSAGGADTVVFTGNRNEYTVTAISFVTANQGTLQAFKISDRTPGRDGSDLVVGVENFVFADRTLTAAQVLNVIATGSVGFTGTEGAIGGTAVARLTPYSALFDADNVTAANPSGAATVPPGGYNWQVSADGGTTWTDIATGTGINRQNGTTDVLSFGTTAGTLVRVQATFNDANGTAETVSSPTWNLIVGSGGNNTLNGTASLTVGDVIYGLAGNDTLNGNAGDDFLYGGNGNDTLNGGAGNDALYGGSGGDTLNGGGGNDYLEGGGGLDTLVGGAGDDTYAIASNGGGGLDAISEQANSGMDSVLASTGYTLGANIENLTLTGSGNFSGTGNAAANVITGNSGNNRLTGAGGADTLTGGAGRDVFDYNATGDSGTTVATRDVIADFVSGSDKLDFSTIDAKAIPGAGGNQAFSAIQLGTSFTAAGQLRYHYEVVAGTEYTVVEGNVNNDLAADFQVALVGHQTFQSSDITL